MFFSGSPNPLAYLAFLAFGPVVWWVFSRMPPTRATAWTLLGGICFLPEVLAFDPPLIPPIDKGSLTSAIVLLVSWIKSPDHYRRARPLRGYDLLFVMVAVGALMTVATNPDPIATGPIVRQGLTGYDAFAGSIKDALYLYFPFLIARAMFRTVADVRTFLEVLLKIGFVYSIVCLIEIRFSPQMHRWVYGYHPADFSMTIRFGGYRPVAFMKTGLATAMFVFSANLAAIALVRTKLTPRKWLPWYRGAVLIVCKSTGAIVYAIVVWPVAALVKKPKLHLPLALALLVVSFPVLRGTGTFPTEELVDLAEGISEERALSLWFRFYNEDQLLERARERVFFGWGGYDRGRVFDPATGEDLSVTDGNWMIELGTRGAVGFLGLYLMLSLPIVNAWRSIKKVPDPRVRILVGTLAMIAALNAVELLPNGLFNFLPYVYAGVLAGIQPGLASLRARPAAKPATPTARPASPAPTAARA